MNQTKFLSKLELTELRRVLDIHRETDLRNVLLIETALATGARASEILSITKQDLNPETQTVFIRGLKSSNDREIPLKPTLFRALIGLGGDKPFPITYQRLVQIWAQYRPVKKGFHSLRHSVALRIFEKHRDIRLVQVVLGHRSIDSTMVYSQYHYEQTELRRLLR